MSFGTHPIGSFALGGEGGTNIPVFLTFADLPVSGSSANDLAVVSTSTGVPFINRKLSGVYLFDGTNWIRLSSVGDFQSSIAVEVSQVDGLQDVLDDKQSISTKFNYDRYDYPFLMRSNLEMEFRIVYLANDDFASRGSRASNLNNPSIANPDAAWNSRMSLAYS